MNYNQHRVVGVKVDGKEKELVKDLSYSAALEKAREPIAGFDRVFIAFAEESPKFYNFDPARGLDTAKS